jgi:hypothetical protein
MLYIFYPEIPTLEQYLRSSSSRKAIRLPEHADLEEQESSLQSGPTDRLMVSCLLPERLCDVSIA